MSEMSQVASVANTEPKKCACWRWNRKGGGQTAESKSGEHSARSRFELLRLGSQTRSPLAPLAFHNRGGGHGGRNENLRAYRS
jgi:hypothetical protein